VTRDTNLARAHLDEDFGLSSGTYSVYHVRDAHADPDHLRRRHRPVAASELEPRATLGAVAALMLAQVTDRSFATSVLATGRGTSQVVGRTHADRRNTHGDAV
jgi:hypothetical protein